MVSRSPSPAAFFLYDLDGNLISDSSKGLKILYDWRGMPVEFLLEPTGSSSDTTRLVMMYDGSGRRISKTILSKSSAATSWDTVKVTHYTGIGTEIREEFAGPAKETKVVVNMPQGLGRYKVADASQPADDNASRTFEWYLKNHLGSTMLVYGTVASTDPNNAGIGETKAAYDYRAFGEMVTLSQPSDKVTENFTGKEHDEEIKLNYFGARYLDPMLGLWVSVDPARQFASPYLYVGNGVNPVNGVDGDGFDFDGTGTYVLARMQRGISSTNDARIDRALNDPHTLFIFKEDDEPGSWRYTQVALEAAYKQNPEYRRYKEIREIYVPHLVQDGDKCEPYSIVTQIQVGHELQHRYDGSGKPGHNERARAKAPSEKVYFDNIKAWGTEENPDPMYKSDYDAAKEFKVYDE